MFTQSLVHKCSEALSIIAPKCKQPKCPSVGEYINKLWYIQTMEWYLAIERNKTSIYTTRMTPKTIMSDKEII